MNEQKPRDVRIAAFAIIWVLLLTLAPKTMLQDPGTFWHTVVGERMLTTGEVVRTDPYTFTHSGEEWLAQQWLGECIMAIAHRYAGLDGVVLLAATLIALTLAIIYGRLASARLNTFASIGLLIIVIGASSYHFIPRPHLATIAGMTLLTLLLVDVESGRFAPRYLWWLPPMFLVWVNIHGGALGGLATLVIYTMIHLLRRKPSDPIGQNIGLDATGQTSTTHAIGRSFTKGATGQLAASAIASDPSIRGNGRPNRTTVTLASVTCLCAATILINPFGPSLPRVWVSLMGSSVLPEVIIEHAPLSLLAPEGMMILALGGLYLFTLARTLPNGIRTAWLLPGIWLLLAISRVRHGPLFAVTAAAVLTDMIPHVSYWRRWQRDDAIDSPTPIHHSPIRFACVVALLFAGAFAIQSAGLIAPIVGAGRCLPTDDHWPVSAVTALQNDAMESDTVAPRVFNDMRFGGYLLYAMPEAALYIDDRCELHRDAGLMRYVELQRHPERLVGESAHYQFDYALLRTDSPVCKYLKTDKDWSLLHTDPTATLFKSHQIRRGNHLTIAHPSRPR